MLPNDILAHPKLETFRARFYENVDRNGPTGCWLWTAAKDPNGYGLASFGGCVNRAHRWAYIFEKGPIGRYSPKRSLSICHTCDNPTCVNPEHLFEGTDADNAADMVAKGRSLKGEEHGASVLTEAAVKAIRRDPRSSRQVAESHGVSQGTVHSVWAYETWQHSDPGAKEELAQYRAERAQPPTYGGAKLTREQVLEIRADDRPMAELAVAYDVTYGTIGGIKAKRVWMDLPGDVVPSRRKPTAKGADRKRKVPEPARVAIRAAEGTLKEIAELYGVSPGMVWQIKHEGEEGKPLARLRRAAETVIASREEMAEGWLVPTEVMAALEAALPKK